MLRGVAAVVGAVFLLVGIAGFVPGVTSNFDGLAAAGTDSEAELLGIFQVSVLHNIVPLLFGVAGLYAAKTAATARLYLLIGGAIYLVLWIYGLLIDLDSDANFVPLNTADNWLHFGLGAGVWSSAPYSRRERPLAVGRDRSPAGTHPRREVAAMRVVITGATGNVGTTVVEALGGEDAVTEIVGVARRAPDWHPPKTHWVEADVARDDLSTVFAGAAAVVHLAWIFQPTHRPRQTWENNVVGSIRVFDAVAAASVPALVHASSVGAYSAGRDERPVDETWPTHAVPTAGYGREKSYVERVLDSFELVHPDVRVVRLRPGFIFKRASATGQRRLFAGPLLPNALVRRELLPVVPDLPGMRFQALHSEDAAEAYRLAVVREVRGPFNIAAEPLVDAAALGRLLAARPVHVPAPLARAALHALWRLRLVPASPYLLDLALSLPVMDTTRARDELGWEPTVSSLDALAEMIDGMRAGAGGPTAPLDPETSGPLRLREFATGVGGTGGVTDDGR